MAQFEFIVIQKKGIENVYADAFSRSNHLNESTKEENEEYQLENEVGELKITYATDLEGDPSEIAKERFAGYSPAMHTMSQKTRH